MTHRMITTTGRPWPKTQRAAVGAVQQILFNHPLQVRDTKGLLNFPDRAVLVNLPRGENPRPTQERLAERLPYRDCAIEIRHRDSLVLGDAVVIFPTATPDPGAPEPEPGIARTVTDSDGTVHGYLDKVGDTRCGHDLDSLTRVGEAMTCPACLGR